MRTGVHNPAGLPSDREVQALIARGRKMRSEALANMLRAAFRRRPARTPVVRHGARA